MYNKRTWLNKDNSPSTGSVVAFDGDVSWKGEIIKSTFLSIADCSVSARLHKTEDDTKQDFIDKMTTLRNDIDEFIEYLKLNEYGFK